MVPIILAAILIISIDLWKNYSDQAKHYFDTYFKYLDYRMPIIITVLSIYYTCIGWYSYHKKIVDEKEAIIKEEIHKLVLLNKKYETYDRQDQLHSIFKTFVQKHSYVQSVQIYSYDLKIIDGNMRIKINYDMGYTIDGLEINAMDQAYYYCNKSMYIAFVKAKKSLDKNQVAPMLKFIRRFAIRLSRVREPNDITSVQYAFVSLALDLLRNSFVVPVSIYNFLTADQIKMFEEHKRTGILRAILLQNNYFLFFHTAIGLKQGRVYTARHLELWGSNKVYLITFHKDVQKDNIDETNIDSIDNEIMVLLKNLEYNNNRRGGGSSNENP